MKTLLIAIVAVPLATASQPDLPVGRRPAAADLVEIAPGVRIDRDRRTVEFDGEIAIDTYNEDSPIVFLELIACTRDTREHESIVVTDITPSALHAALLAAGFEPGRPGSVVWHDGRAERKPASGDPVDVFIRVTDPDTGDVLREVMPWEWVVSIDSLEEADRADAAWIAGRDMVFAGSRFAVRQGRERYDADGTGTVIGLTTFGMEVISPVEAISHESAIDEPVWIARPDTLPVRGTPVTVILRPSETPPTNEPDQ